MNIFYGLNGLKSGSIDCMHISKKKLYLLWFEDLNIGFNFFLEDKALIKLEDGGTKRHQEKMA